MAKNKYQSSNVRWLIEFYPFDTTIPHDDDTPNLPTAPAAIIGSVKEDVSSLIDLINDQKAKLNIQDGQTEIARGLKRISLNRSKATPDSKCALSFQGPLPSAAYVGVWVVVTSVNGEKGSKNLVRFIGQIESIDCGYQVRGDNTLIQQSNIVVREWSSILKYSVRFDRYSLAAESVSSAGNNGATLNTLAATAIAGKDSPIEKINDIISKSYDPLELAQTVLDLVGALNKGDALTSQATTDLGLPSLAMTMPSVPQSVMARLKVADSLSALVPFDSDNPYQSGFVGVATGSLTESYHNDDKWNGIFDPGEIEEIKDSMKDAYSSNPLKPKALGIGAMLQANNSAWGMISNYCEPLVFEYYTDIWYENGPTGLIAKPTIIMRDKPFALDTLSKERGPSYNDLKKFTAYDNLPRVYIDDVNITAFRVNNNLINSPNYFLIQYSNNAMDANLQKTFAVANSIERLDPEMRRFGGHDLTPEVQFLGIAGEENTKAALSGAAQTIAPDAGEAQDSTANYFKVLRDLLITWHAFDYQMGTGVLSIKDNNYAISIGWNVTFDFGAYTFCGHVDGIGLEFYIDDEGLEVSNMNLTLSRIVLVESDNTLQTVDPTVWGDLFNKNRSKSPSVNGTDPLSTFKGLVNGNIP